MTLKGIATPAIVLEPLKFYSRIINTLWPPGWPCGQKGNTTHHSTIFFRQARSAGNGLPFSRAVTPSKSDGARAQQE